MKSSSETPVSSTPNLESVNTDSYFLILSFLNYKDGINLAVTNKRLYREYSTREEFLFNYIESSLKANSPIDINSRINAKNNPSLVGCFHGSFPIIAATKIQSYRCVKLLVKNGVKIKNVTDTSGYNAVYIAMSYARPDILKELLKVDDPTDTCLAHPSKIFSILPSALVQSQADENKQKCFKIYQEYVLQKVPDGLSGFIKQVNLQFQASGRSNKISDDFIPIKKAIMRHNKTELRDYRNLIAGCLHFYGGDSDPSRFKRSIIHWAVVSGSVSITRLLLTLNTDGIAGDTKNLAEIIKNTIKAFVNQQDSNGDTPLHSAALVCHLKMVKLLVKYGAWDSFSVRNNKGKIPLDLARQGGPHSDKRRHLKTIKVYNFLCNKPAPEEASLPTEQKSSESEKLVASNEGLEGKNNFTGGSFSRNTSALFSSGAAAAPAPCAAATLPGAAALAREM